MKNRLVLLLNPGVVMAVLACCPPAGAAQQPPDAAVVHSTAPSPALHSRESTYRLKNGDAIDVDFALSPEFNQTLDIQPDGFISLKNAGTIPAEGLTVNELASAVRSAYSGILHNPIITVSLKDFPKPYFIVTGQVARPGKYDLRGPLTVTQAVAIAGGFSDKAKHTQVVLFRPSPGAGFEVKVVDAKKLLATRNLSEDLRLMPGDTIYVPQNVFSHIRPFLPSTAVGAYYNPALY